MSGAICGCLGRKDPDVASRIRATGNVGSPSVTSSATSEPIVERGQDAGLEFCIREDGFLRSCRHDLSSCCRMRRCKYCEFGSPFGIAEACHKVRHEEIPKGWTLPCCKCAKVLLHELPGELGL